MDEKKKAPVTAKISRAWKSPQAAWASVAVLILAVMIVAVMVGMSIFAPVKSAETTTPTVPSGTATSSGLCNVPPGDLALRPAIPKDLRWMASKGVTWPVSDTYGPTQSEQGFDVCFARSPTGAALALTTFMYSQYNGHTVKELTDFYVVDSPGKTKALADADGGSAAGDVVEQGIAIVGFIADSFTQDRAQISLVLTVPNSKTGYIGIPGTVVWDEGDWKIELLDDGSSAAGSPSSPVKGQFVEWADS